MAPKRFTMAIDDQSPDAAVATEGEGSLSPRRALGVRMAFVLLSLLCALWTVSLSFDRDNLPPVIVPAGAALALLGFLSARWSFALWTLALPLFTRFPTDHGVPNFSLCLVGLIPLLGGMAARRAIGDRVGLTALRPHGDSREYAWLMASFLVVAGLSSAVWLSGHYPLTHPAFGKLLASSWPRLFAVSEYAPFFTFRTFFACAGGAAAFFLARSLGRSVNGRAPILFALSAGAGCAAAYGFYQYFSESGILDFWRFEGEPKRINATLLDPNSCGTFLAGSLLVVMGLSRWPLGKAGPLAPRDGGFPWEVLSRFVLLPLFCVALLAALAMTHSGAAIFGVALATPLMAAMRVGGLSSFERFVRRRRDLLWALLLSALAAVWVFSLGLDASDARTLQSFNRDSKTHRLFRGRPNVWRAGLLMLASHPTFGLGTGSFYQSYPQYRAQTAPNWNPSQENAHNQFLQVAAAEGVIGLTAFVALIALILRRALGVVAGLSRGSNERAQRAGLLAAMVCYLATCLTGHPMIPFETNAWFWIVAGLAVAGSARDSLERVDLARAFPSGANQTNGAEQVEAGDTTDCQCLGDTKCRQCSGDTKCRQWAVGVAVALMALSLASFPWRMAERRRANPPDSIYFGTHETEYDPIGMPFCWSTSHSTKYTMIQYPYVAFELGGPTGPNYPLTAKISIDRHQVDTLQIDRPRRCFVCYWVGDKMGKYTRIDVEVDKTFTPARLNPASKDVRELGVQLVYFRL